MTDIVFASDIHVDMMNQLKINWPDGDILVLAGDVANELGKVFRTLSRLSAKYQHVVFTDGNHESYSNMRGRGKNKKRRRTVAQTREAIRRGIPHNVHYLTHGNPHVTIAGIDFVGVNGWYSCDVDNPGQAFDPVEMYQRMDDYGFNDPTWVGFSPTSDEHPWELARLDAALVNDTISSLEGNRPLVVLTHTAPHRDLVRWQGIEAKDRTNLFYVNTHMSEVMRTHSDRISLWVNGHTHYPRETYVEGVHCLINPRGSSRDQNPHWTPIVFHHTELTRG